MAKKVKKRKVVKKSRTSKKSKRKKVSRTKRSRVSEQYPQVDSTSMARVALGQKS